MGRKSAFESDCILAGYWLAVKDEEGRDLKLFPLVEILVDVRFDAGQAAQGGQEGFVSGGVVEQQAEIVGGIDGEGAVLELGYVVGAVDQESAQRPALCFLVEGSGSNARSLVVDPGILDKD